MARISLIAFFVWIFLEGILRKWVFPDYSSYLFLFKYALLFIPFMNILTGNIRISKKDYPFMAFLIIYLLWCFVEFFNFRLTNDLRVKVLGLLVHFSFVPLIFIIPRYINNEEKVFSLFEKIIYLSIPIFLFGIYQYYSPVYSPINKYVAEGVEIARIGDRARITSVFSYIAPYTSFLSFTMVVILILIFQRKIKTYNKIIFYLVAILCFVNLLMTGSRGPLIVIIMIVLLFLLYTLIVKSSNKKRILFSFGIFMILLFLLINFTGTGNTAYSKIKTRVVKSGDITIRIKHNYKISGYISRSGLAGYGLGTSYQGSVSLIKDFKDMPDVESENSRILVELGLIGFVIIFLLRLKILLYSIKVLKNTKNESLKLICLIAVLYQLPTVLTLNNTIYNYMENIIYWLLISIVVTVRKINVYNRKKAALRHHYNHFFQLPLKYN